MSLDPPVYLASTQNNVRARPIAWEGAVRAGHITEDDLKLIKAVDKVRKEPRREAAKANIDAYAKFIVGGTGSSVLSSGRPDVVQYTLVLSSDLFKDVPELQAATLQTEDPFKPFLSLIAGASNPEDPIPILAASILSELISAALLGDSRAKAKTGAEKALPEYYKYLSSLAKASDSGLQDIAVQFYSNVLRSKKSREVFWDLKEDTLAPLVQILGSAAGLAQNGDAASTVYSGASVRGGDGISSGIGLQLLYHVLLVIWQLSFEGSAIAESLDKEFDIIPLYTQLVRISPKEKTTRLIVSTLLNLLSSSTTALLPAAILARLPAALQTLSTRHLTDEDLTTDLQDLQTMIEDYTKTQTTFDEYAAEVRSGNLRWSPPHRSSTFWTENARKILSENQGELPKKLAEILAKSWDNDKQVLAIACNDVGCLVREVSEQRPMLEKLGLKARVMELMTDTDESVRWESLRAVGEWLRYSFDR